MVIQVLQNATETESYDKKGKYLYKKIIYLKKCCHKYQHKNITTKYYIFINKLLFQKIYIRKTRHKVHRKFYQKVTPKKTIKSPTKSANQSKYTAMLKCFPKFEQALMHNNIYDGAHFKKLE